MTKASAVSWPGVSISTPAMVTLTSRPYPRTGAAVQTTWVRRVPTAGLATAALQADGAAPPTHTVARPATLVTARRVARQAPVPAVRVTMTSYAVTGRTEAAARRPDGGTSMAHFLEFFPWVLPNILDMHADIDTRIVEALMPIAAMAVRVAVPAMTTTTTMAAVVATRRR